MNIGQLLMSPLLVNENQLILSQFRVSSFDEQNYIATFAFCVAPGHFGNNIILI